MSNFTARLGAHIFAEPPPAEFTTAEREAWYARRAACFVLAEMARVKTENDWDDAPAWLCTMLQAGRDAMVETERRGVWVSEPEIVAEIHYAMLSAFAAAHGIPLSDHE